MVKTSSRKRIPPASVSAKVLPKRKPSSRRVGGWIVPISPASEDQPADPAVNCGIKTETNPTTTGTAKAVPLGMKDVTGGADRFSAHTHDRYGDVYAYQQKIADALRRGGEGLPAPEELATMLPAHGASVIVRCLSQNPHDTLTVPGADDRAVIRSEVVMLPRAVEESWMREARVDKGERSCINASLPEGCFASLVESGNQRDSNFALVEFPDPTTLNLTDEGEEFRSTINGAACGTASVPRPCILCLHKEICKNLMTARCRGEAVNSRITYSSIGNYVDRPGEYCSLNTVVSSATRYEGLAVPVMVPQPHHYRVQIQKGRRYLEQLLPAPQGRQTNFFF